MSTLIIRLPSKAAADSAPNWLSLACPFALASASDAVEREGAATLSELAPQLAKAQRVILIAAASDVTLLRVKVPPLSAARLRQALPNLVEDQLITDPADSVIVAGAEAEGLRTVAAAQRAWLDNVMKVLLGYGARHVAIVPAQLCLPFQAGGVAAAVAAAEGEIELTLRLSEQEGIGLPVMTEPGAPAAAEALSALSVMVPSQPVTLYVPQAELRAYQEQIDAEPGLKQRITLANDHWARWIAGSKNAGVNLASGLAGGGGAPFEWRPWRWPAVLALLVLVVNAGALNYDWFRLKREADALRDNMTRIYKAAFPKETVVLDPVAQMKQKIGEAQVAAGQIAPDDFLALSARFGQAWTQAAPAGKTAATALASFDYRDHALWLKWKAPGEVPVQQLRNALTAQRLSYYEPEPGVWKIGNVK